jgi:flagellar basal-body rod modification protein FlgD
MSVTATTTTNSTNTTTNASGSLTSIAGGNAALKGVSFDTYLKLLVAQIKNQDPLNPMDGTQFTSQLAQFSQLEQQINSNTYLKDILAQRDFGEQTLANSYLGKQVLGPGNLFSKEGTNTVLGYEIAKTSSVTTLEIINNASGTVVRTIRGETAPGKHIITWNGKTDSGTVAAEGAYTLRLKATNAEGKNITSQGYVYGQVASIYNDGAEVALQLSDGRSITAGSVMGVR